MPLPTAVTANPDKLAHVMAATGEGVTYRELDERSIRFSRVLADHGIGPGDVVAVLMENHIRYPEVFWGIIRAGALITAVNRYLTAEEVAYIVEDSGAKALVTSARLADVATAVVDRTPICTLRLMVDGTASGYASYEQELASRPSEPLTADEPQGDFMNYSSGTTGRPKGVKRASAGLRLTEAPLAERLFTQLLTLDAESVYLSTAPLYHSAPLAAMLTVQGLGGTVVIMDRFDPASALATVERYRVTHSQWVPTMFVRLLKLSEEERTRYDLSSQRVAVHAAAPCPVEIKHRMIEWWGPIVREYYGGTELNGVTFITAEDWLTHPGSVGKAIVGTIHICDEDGIELPTGTAGLVYFEREQRNFEYHNDAAKTRDAEHPDHPSWTTIGDIGYLDDEGYLYLTDRRAFTIVSGGVNIYPQEIEDLLVVHPKVADVAVFGIPDPEMGEQVKAVVQPAPGVEPSDELAAELTAFARKHLASFKVPRSVDFRAQLPRLDTGKLYKDALRQEYREKAKA